MKMKDPRKKLKMKFDKRHFKILFYVYDKMLAWNCWSKK